MNYFSRAVLPIVAMAAFGQAGCADSEVGVLTPPPPQVNMRFVNAIVDAQGDILLVANNTRVGSPVAFGAAGTTCTAINPGTLNLAFGTASTTGTRIATSLGTVSRNFPTAGDFTVIATGIAASPQLLVFSDEPAITPPAGSAAVRFVSVVPGAEAFDVFATPPGVVRSVPVVSSLTFGTTNNAFVNVPLGSSQLVFTSAGTNNVAFTMPTLLTLTAGDVRTVLLGPRPGVAGFEAFTVQRC